jgi:hypothetical protein
MMVRAFTLLFLLSASNVSAQTFFHVDPVVNLVHTLDSLSELGVERIQLQQLFPVVEESPCITLEEFNKLLEANEAGTPITSWIRLCPSPATAETPKSVTIPGVIESITPRKTDPYFDIWISTGLGPYYFLAGKIDGFFGLPGPLQPGWKFDVTITPVP